MNQAIEHRVERGRHVARFYDDAAFPAAVIARHLATGLNAGGPALVIATPAHSASIARALGPGAADVTWLDAQETLNQIFESEATETDPFEECVGSLVRSVSSAGTLVHAYGEMVDVLTRQGRMDDALRLEDRWNALSEDCGLDLLCGYSLSSFRRAADEAAFGRVCGKHTSIAPTEVLVEREGWRASPARVARRSAAAESPDRGAWIESQHAETSRLRDELIGIASHELRNPIHVVSLNLRAALTAIDRGDSTPNVRMRLATAEVQVQRLGALLDRMLRTSGLLAGELGLEPADFDLADAIRTVLDRMSARLVTSDLTVDLPPVRGRWDRSRVEQIVEHLLLHAVTFSGGHPVRLSLQGFPDFVYLSLCDCGLADDSDAPIRPASATPTARDPSTEDFGLWTARQLTEAMGGTIATGRPGPGRFRVILTLPREGDRQAARSA